MLAANPGDFFSMTEQDGGGDLFPREARGSSNDPFIVAFRQNDFAIALPCDIKKPIEQIHASHRVRKTRSCERGHQ
jgi:hypothetical protein